MSIPTVGALMGILAMHLAMPPWISAQEPPAVSKPYAYAPETVSTEFQEYLRNLPDPATRPPAPAADDVEGWKAYRAALESERIPAADATREKYGVTVTPRELGGVAVLDVKPRNWRDNGKVLVYTHGGAYTLLSARTTMPSVAPVVGATGLRIVSVDYTTAPHAKWQAITDQVIAVIQALQAEGYGLDDIAIYGDSAGGGLAAGSVLKMRDRGLGMPAAVVLWSPWSDVTETGDTYVTLKAAEPNYLFASILKPSADAYADPADQKHPYVSPVYGDYAKGFPPTLLQGGTKEIFVSNFVRHYQAIDAAGQTVKLDLYEGMPHVFQNKLPEAPESRLAIGKMKAFLQQHLDE